MLLRLRLLPWKQQRDQKAQTLLRTAVGILDTIASAKLPLAIVVARTITRIKVALKRKTDQAGQGILVNGYDGIDRCLLPADGAPVWTYQTEDYINGTPAIAEHRELVFIGSKDKQLHAVGTETGEAAWTFRTGGPIGSSPLVFDNAVLFGSNDGRLYAVSHDGEEIWKLDLGEKLTAPPIFARNRIIITGAKGTVFVIK